MSSDSVVFKIFRKYLDAGTAGFPSLEAVVVDQQPVLLQESSQVLELLFQFIHPRSGEQPFRQPMITDVDTILFFQVAEAAEKYVVFGAMNLFVTRMH